MLLSMYMMPGKDHGRSKSKARYPNKRNDEAQHISLEESFARKKNNAIPIDGDESQGDNCDRH